MEGCTTVRGCMYCKLLRKGSYSSIFLLIQAAFLVLPPLRPTHMLIETTKQEVEGVA